MTVVLILTVTPCENRRGLMKTQYGKILSILIAALLLLSADVLAGGAGTAHSQAPVGNELKSYREWKNTMVDAAQLRVQKTKNSLEQHRQLSGLLIDPNLKNQLSKEQLRAALASELTINDYFVGYLNKQTNLQQAIKGVAGKLSDDEVAELMSAYAYSFNRIEIKPLKSASEAAPRLVFD